MKFVKMHGAGNDYVYLDAVTDPAVAARLDASEWPALVRRMSDRHKGIGSDGVIGLCPPSDAARAAGAHVRMRMFNADGSESEMCGNGVRCVAKFAHDRLAIEANPMLVETGRGVLSIAYELAGEKLRSATVDMGEPILDAGRVPVEVGNIEARAPHRAVLRGASRDDEWTFVSMGNPHAVAWVDVEDARRLARALGPSLETHPAFPRRANIHFATAHSPTHARMDTWERGAGITQACGTGACAVLVAGVLTGRLSREADIDLPGGTLHIRWDERTNHVFMTGPAEDVFEGVWLGEGAQVGVVAPPIEPVELRTARLLLRPFAPDDAADLVRCLNDKRITGMTATMPHPYTAADAAAWLVKQAALRREGKATVLAICEAGPSSRGTLVGAVGLHGLEAGHQRAEMGYWIAVDHWGKGYATEAGRAMLDYGFRSLGLQRIHACHFAKNPPSGRVLEKVGMRPEGVALRHAVKWGEPQDIVNYGVTREAWEAER